MTHSPVSIAVMGAGLIGKRHIAHIAEEPSTALSAIVDPTEESRALAASYTVPWFPDLPALLAHGRPEGLIIATPNQMHLPHGLEAIAAGIPTLIEKPLADDLNAATRLVEAAEKAGIALLTGHHRRHNPMIQQAKKLIEAGRLGRIVTVHGFFWLMKPDDYFAPDWRRQEGAGPILTNLSHDLDLLRYLVGEIEAVQAFQSNAIRNFAVEETSAIILRFANGALGTMNISDTVVAPWSWEHTTGENAIYPQTDQICYHLGGTQGSLAIPRLDLWHNGETRSWWEPFHVERTIAARQDPLRLQIQQFARVIRGEEAPLVSGREGLNTLRVIAAVKQAAKSGEMVRMAQA